MTTDPRWKIRQSCLAAIRQCERAEQQASQSAESAAKVRESALVVARQRSTLLRSEANAVLNELNQTHQVASQILVDLAIQSRPVSATGQAAVVTNPDEVTRTLQQQRLVARQWLVKLKATAQELRVERGKWWKFW